jgi:hypothetical protein
MEQSDGLSANRMNKISMCLRGKYCEGSMAQYRTVAFVEAGSYNFELYIPTFYKGRRLTAAVKTARLSWADKFDVPKRSRRLRQAYIQKSV